MKKGTLTPIIFLLINIVACGSGAVFCAAGLTKPNGMSFSENLFMFISFIAIASLSVKILFDEI